MALAGLLGLAVHRQATWGLVALAAAIAALAMLQRRGANLLQLE